MKNSQPSAIGMNSMKASRERSLQKMNRLIKSSSWGVDNTSSPYIFAASLFVVSPLTRPFLDQFPVIQAYPAAGFFVNAFLYLIAGVVLVNVLRSKLFNYYFCKSNADLFIDELRNFKPIAVDNLDGVCESIKKQDYNGHWVGYALNIVNSERQALLNS